MADLEALLSSLANADAQHDLEGLRSVREQIVAHHPDSEAAVEALYKIGLDHLFRERNLELAVAKFEEAAKRRAPFWSDAARTSLGLCYHHQKRTQKAFFELRKVAYQESPTPHSVTALVFIEMLYENEGNKEETKRVRKERIGQLERLVKSPEPSERGFYMFQLGLALRDQGDDTRATQVLNDAKALGPEKLGAELYRSIVEALR